MGSEDRRGHGCACTCLSIPGFCFEPSDEQLVGYYLKEKIARRRLYCDHIVGEFKIYDDDLMPWEIIKDHDHHWITSGSNYSSNTIKKTVYVFTRLCKKKTEVMRRSGTELCKKKTKMMRRSGDGSWTGQNTNVVKNVAGDIIGYNKLLTFYRDNVDKSRKKKIVDEDYGHWNMHEYSLLGIDDYVICKITKEVMINIQVPGVIVASDINPRRGEENMNKVSGYERQVQVGHVNQDLDVFGKDWHENGWINELYQQFDGADQNEIVNGTVVDVDQELPPILAETNEPNVPNSYIEKDVQGVQELQEDVLDGVDNRNVIEILDDDNIQELPLIGVADEAENNRASNDWMSYLNYMDGTVDILDINIQVPGVIVASDINPRRGEENMNKVSGYERQVQAGHVNQDLDVFGNDWHENGWIDELYQQFDGADQNEIVNGTVVDVDQELPILAETNEPSVTNSYIEKAVQGVQELPFVIWGKNNESLKGLDGDDNRDVIEILHDDNIQELPLIGVADEAENNRASNDWSSYLNYMDGTVAIPDINFNQVEAALAAEPEPTHMTLGGILDPPSYDIINLGANQINLGADQINMLQNYNIFEEQLHKRTRTNVDYQKFPSRKKQRYLEI